MTGDLTECGLEAEYAHFADILRRNLPVPAYVIPGNHDRRDNLRAGLAHLPGVTADPDYVQYTVDGLAVRLVMLDTLVPGESHGLLRDEQLDWLDRVLAADTSKATMIGMHHPPFATGLPHMDKIALLNAHALRSVVAKHRQVERIVCGHHHRPIVGSCAHAIVTVGISVAHQVELTFDPSDPGAFNFEPPAVQLHSWSADTGFVTHTLYTDTYSGPFPFVTDPDYPGAH